ncbi:SDR family oxidoreductase [Aspergillus udagawae]|uniref:Short-chain dehydrogenase/reductase 3 n=1 Tax=Aspergillus udagawae TaxID=91492 RepID=A0A8E0R1C7_9EURO|nr:uncharacterized protein Aud_009011 [Aspergillus udagawae]GIC92543.1 hypothetical protein Aud_009011 [Aspergillus udagawae]
MSLDSALNMARQYAQSSLAQLPEPAQNALLNPLVQKALTVALVYGALRQTNRVFSRWSMNNWQTAHPWQGDRELVLVSGGCSGIGKQIMEDLASQGIRVVILDINEPNFQLPRNVHFFKADITNSESIKAVAGQIRQKLGDPTVLVNNAGVGHDGTILEEPEAKIRQTFEVNTISHFLMVREFLPSMIRQNHGHVITIASMASFVALGEMVDYCCSKASALAFHEGLTQELRYWYQAKKVRTSVIHPLWVRTPMIQQLTEAGNQFKQPVMTPQVVSDAVVKQILTQSSGQVILPTSHSAASMVRAFPQWFQETVRGIASGSLRRLRELQAAQKI